ncbi:hypothetical protein HK096_006861, partial [Nowakowskiella sp. JEL0078]
MQTGVGNWGKSPLVVEALCHCPYVCWQMEPDTELSAVWEACAICLLALGSDAAALNGSVSLRLDSLDGSSRAIHSRDVRKVASIFPCGHLFHSACIFEWHNSNISENKKPSCPKCRKRFQRDDLVLLPCEFTCVDKTVGGSNLKDELTNRDITITKLSELLDSEKKNADKSLFTAKNKIELKTREIVFLANELENLRKKCSELEKSLEYDSVGVKERERELLHQIEFHKNLNK